MILTVTVRVGIVLPDEEVEDNDIQEWLKYELGGSGPIREDNPLYGTKIDIKQIIY